MTMRTRSALICQCGHKGELLLSENDQPFSSRWERYQLIGFDGGSLTLTDRDKTPPDLLAALKPVCPACGASGKVTYAR